MERGEGYGWRENEKVMERKEREGMRERKGNGERCGTM